MTPPDTPRPGIPQWMSRQSPTVQKVIMAACVVLSILVIWFAIIPLMKSSYEAGRRSVQTPG